MDLPEVKDDRDECWERERERERERESGKSVLAARYDNDDDDDDMQQSENIFETAHRMVSKMLFADDISDREKLIPENPDLSWLWFQYYLVIKLFLQSRVINDKDPL